MISKKRSLWLTLLIVVTSLYTSCVFAASTASLAPQVKFTALDSNGDPYSGAKLYTYETGTTTPKTTWTDSTKGTPNTNPIVLDSRGQADVWLDSSGGAYRLKLDDADEVTLWTKDGIEAINQASITTTVDAAIAAAINGNVGVDYYYPDYSAAAQGVTGAGSTIKAYSDTIGAYYAVMYFRNNSGSATPQYKLDTS